MAKTRIYYLIDQSGSMYDVVEDVKGGYKTYVEGLAGIKGTRFTTITFDTKTKVICDSVKPAEVPELAYRPSGGTALNDALGTTIRRAELAEKKGDRIVIVVMTDGEENSSVEFTHDKIQSLIKEKNDLNNWTFVYMAADPKSFRAGHAYGFAAGNSLLYDKGNMAGTYSTLTRSTQAFTQSADPKAVDFFVQELPASEEKPVTK